MDVIKFSKLTDKQEPGIYQIDFNSYKDIKAINNSTLRLVDRYPHGYVRLNETSSFRMGSALHSMVLEPHKFEEEYVESGCKDKRSKKYLDLVKDNPGKVILSDGEFSQLITMKNLISSSEVCSSLLDTPYKEITIIFERDGNKCKARIDALKLEGNAAIIVDLKTSVSLENSSLKRSIYEYGYDCQAEFYSFAVQSLFPNKEVKFCNIFCETPSSTKAYAGCKATYFSDETIENAMTKNINSIEYMKNSKYLMEV